VRRGARRFGARRIGAGQWQMADAAAASDMAAYGRGELMRGRESVRVRGRSSARAQSHPYPCDRAGSSTVWRGTRGARRAHGQRRGQLGHGDHAQGGESRESYTWA